jgi:hypothetical protein
MSETHNDPSDSTRVRERCEDAPCCGCCGPDAVGGGDFQPFDGLEGQCAGDNFQSFEGFE